MVATHVGRDEHDVVVEAEVEHWCAPATLSPGADCFQQPHRCAGSHRQPAVGEREQALVQGIQDVDEQRCARVGGGEALDRGFVSSQAPASERGVPRHDGQPKRPVDGRARERRESA